MNRTKRILRKLHTPVTIMLVPHSRFNSRSFRVPFIFLISTLCFSIVGVIYTISVSVQAFKYYQVKRKFADLSQEFRKLESSMVSLKHAASQLKRLSPDAHRNAPTTTTVTAEDEGAIDIEALQQQIHASTSSIREISVYLAKQRNRQLATPFGWPATGRISSGYGMRHHPAYGTDRFHSGVDISMPTGTPVHATADGIVSFSGQNSGNGNVIAVEHGHGFSTIYAHNSRNTVRTGQTVKRGETIAYSGSTGLSTGPHLHYEVWRNTKSVNPMPFIEENAN